MSKQIIVSRLIDENEKERYKEVECQSTGLGFQLSFVVVFLPRYDIKHILGEDPSEVSHEEGEESHDAVDDDIF